MAHAGIFLHLKIHKGGPIEIIKRTVLTYMFLLGGILLLAYSMSANGFAADSSSAWFLVKGIRTMLLCIGGIAMLIWLLSFIPSWLTAMDEGAKHRHEERNKEIQTMIESETNYLARHCSDISDRINVLEKRLKTIECERKKVDNEPR